MSAATTILARIRAANAGNAPPAAVPRHYLGAGQRSTDDLVARFAARVEDYRAEVRICAPEALAETLRAVLGDAPIDLVVPGGFDDRLLPRHVRRVLDSPPLTVDQLDAAAGVVTTCALAIAETGTIVLDAGPGQGRRALTLLPDLHVVVVHADQIVAGVPDALARLVPTRPLTWISGPSATSDIELRRIEGVHGPRTLRVVVVTG